MKKIRITAVPPGQAPLEIREQWIGVEILLPEQNESSFQMGVQGGAPQNEGGYQVETSAAIKALEAKSPDAANWWKQNYRLENMPRLAFAKSVCELVLD